ncbi:hypothetical protein EJB05_09333, partial [Eragrostis curvula]
MSSWRSWSDAAGLLIRHILCRVLIFSDRTGNRLRIPDVPFISQSLTAVIIKKWHPDLQRHHWAPPIIYYLQVTQNVETEYASFIYDCICSVGCSCGCRKIAEDCSCC